MARMWQIEFTSADFLPFLPEECQVNPGVYGFELASWLSQELARNGVVTSYPIGEDWGWLLEHAADGGATVTIGCASQTDPAGGYAASPVAWSVFVEARRALRSRGKADRAASTAEVGQAIREALAAAGIEVTEVGA